MELKFLVTDNKKPNRNVVVYALTLNQAKKKGMSILKTDNVKTSLTEQEKGTICLAGFPY